ncbi:tRNA (adenosine(37)-N6)-threonylcarbamoyltransferase complex transferase subunit TsaD [Buchnera aphidicola]|uniref:tRNA (adenosine(37)-N6)-threonylcarbamoyltransferase complex transferase subunit TsaD n=1 Tax=Buchnera aphidicola TaxID=9 RepID=UPI0031B850A4
MKILGIETSCDDTCVAIYDFKNKFIISSISHHHDNININYGGIVPEMSSREHMIYIDEILIKLFKKSNLSIYDIDAIAYTAGPGMVGSLLVGATIATSLSYLTNIPLIAINHIEAHLYSPFIENDIKIYYPFLGLLISGGNTQLIQVFEFGKYKILGKTLDDSIGNTFDKISKLLNLNYPWGSNITILAKKGRSGKFLFPRPMIHSSCLNFSFSGLKTYVTKIINKYKYNKQKLSDIAKEFENSIFDSLIFKCKKAFYKTGYNRLVVSGGVSANKTLRKKLYKMKNNYSILFPKLEFCTDNAVMIAYLGGLRFQERKKNVFNIFIKPKWNLNQL